MIVDQDLNHSVIKEFEILALGKTVDEVLTHRGVRVDVWNVDIL